MAKDGSALEGQVATHIIEHLKQLTKSTATHTEFKQKKQIYENTL